MSLRCKVSSRPLRKLSVSPPPLSPGSLQAPGRVRRVSLLQRLPFCLVCGCQDITRLFYYAVKPCNLALQFLNTAVLSRVLQGYNVYLNNGQHSFAVALAYAWNEVKEQVERAKQNDLYVAQREAEQALTQAEARAAVVANDPRIAAIVIRPCLLPSGRLSLCDCPCSCEDFVAVVGHGVASFASVVRFNVYIVRYNAQAVNM